MSTLNSVVGEPRVVGQDLDLPEDVREEAGICDGETVVVLPSPEGVLITVIDAEQA